jgi:ligand-binding sensor domain-containing protein
MTISHLYFQFKLFDKKFNKWIISFFLIYTTLLGFAKARQVPDPVAAKFEHFSIEQGLSNNSITSILQDKSGFIWVGTEDGLNKFNGYTWIIFKHDPQDSSSISFGAVSTLYEDHNGFIWIGIDGGGINLYNPYTGTFKHIRHDPSNKNSIVSNHVKCIYEDSKGLFWIATWKGINMYDKIKDKWTLFQNVPSNNNSISDNDVKCIKEDSDGLIWIGTTYGLNSFNKTEQKFKRYFANPSNINSLSSNNIMCISNDANDKNTIWIGTIKGINSINKLNNNILHYSYDESKKGLSPNDNDIKVILDDHEGTLWLGTFGGGLNAFSKADKHFTYFMHSDANFMSISDNYIKSAYKDKEGILWIGTPDGLNALNTNTTPFHYFKNDPKDPSTISNNSVWAFYEKDPDHIWIGTKKGLNSFHTRTYLSEERSIQTNPLFTTINCLYQDKKSTLWIGTNAGLYNYTSKDKKATLFFPKILHSKVTFVFEDTDNLIWIGTYDGLFCYTNKTKNASPVRIQATFNNQHFYCGLQDKTGRLWFGTFGSGLFYYDKKKNELIKIQNWPGKSNGGNHYVITIFSDTDENLWIGTYGEGLYVFNKKQQKIMLYTMNDGLPSNVINGITSDKNKHLWISTNNGISRMNLSPERLDRFRNYDKNEGLQSLDFNSGAAYHDNAGNIYFGATNGLTVFNPDSIVDNEKAPPIIISKFKVLEQDFPLDSDITYKKHIYLKYSQNLFSLEFSALSYLAPENNQYAYKLEGIDTGWVRVKNRHYVSYTNLDPGTYTFQIIGANPIGVWNKKGTSLQITIAPPFWKETWFEFLLIILALFILYAIIKASKRKLKKQKELHEVNNKIAEFKLIALRSQMNPHFIFNSLSAIQYFITTDNKDAAINYLSKFAKLIRQILENSINTRILLTDEIDFIKCYLEIESLRFENKLEYHIAIDESIDIHNIEIPSMLIQPFIENSIIHGLMNKNGKGVLKIQLENQNNFISCTIEDNGVGRIEASKIKRTKLIEHKSVGMAVTHDRLEILNRDQENKVSMEIEDLYTENGTPSGTKVTINIPVEN